MHSLTFLSITIIFIINTLTYTQTIQSWLSTISTVSMHPTFVCQLTQGQIIKGFISLNSSYNYQIHLYRPNEYYPNSAPFQKLNFTGSTNFQLRPVDSAGFWRIEIWPIDKLFIFTIELSTNNQLLGRYVDIARTKKIMVLHFQTNENCNFSVVDLPMGLSSDVVFQLYQGSTIMDFNMLQLVYSSSGTSQTTFSFDCKALQSAYYYLVISASIATMPLFPRVLVNYQSDMYPCPVPLGYKDVNNNFDACVQMSAPSLSYPCISYDYQQYKCSACQSNFILQGGNCYQSKDCGIDQYFNLGECFNVIAHCTDFQIIGGLCKNCSSGYELMESSQGQLCYQYPTNTQNQYYYYQPNTTTTKTTSSATSATTNSSTTTVTTKPTYITPTTQNNPATQTSSTPVTNASSTKTQTTKPSLTTQLNPATPTYIPQSPKIDCGTDAYQKNGLCIMIPPNCQIFNTTVQMCYQCKSSFTLNPATLDCVVANVVCPSGFTNIGDQCISFPNNCVQTNSLGNCTACSINYSLIDGNCSHKSCPARQYLSNGQCLNVSQYCGSYDPYRGFCLNCLNNYILDNQGICNAPSYYQSSNGCGPRKYQSGNLCFPVDPTCNQFDQSNGNCLSCIDPTDLLDRSTGKCIKLTDICQDRYYFSSLTKTCVEVNPYCSTYDKTTGYCLSCINGLTLFRGGCMYLSACAVNQYRNQDGMCVKADPLCNGVDQTTGGCLDCISGYQIINGGVCCFAQNYLLKAQCKAALSLNCLQQRPVFLNCLKCAPGYELSNGVFGKCKLTY